MEEKFVPFFQKNINIVLDNKVLRHGIFLLFSIKEFYLHFTLLTNNVQKNFEMPYPFDVYKESPASKELIMDYRLDTLTRKMPDIEDSVRLIYSKEVRMKYFDSVVKLVEV